ncbi:hypothetical protein CCAX7_001270 [Capsulimonas corticalis]|uniref:IPT/TIG domain-containing protein n=1 Tax=Capsulimonas corticalis TaxID=2219043 RepID=A0A402CRV7_9BACT|nr:chitobiase/beta-hexosaminidase C-terminal domain-containing protein [Capsulimonas corticalis]BDI28076.1 hypothetical protein CCAX7_001270 [Capsulimonas corticalis]
MSRLHFATSAAVSAASVLFVGFASHCADAQAYTVSLLNGAGAPLTVPQGYQGQLVGGTTSAVMGNPGGPIISLDPPAYFGSTVAGIYGANQMGSYNEAKYTYYSKRFGWRTFYTVHAILWSGSDKNFVDLHPTSLTLHLLNGTSAAAQSWGTAISQGQEVGYATDSSGYDHPILWKGTAASAVDLLPSVWYDGVATAVDHGIEVGYGTSGLVTHAALWKGTAASFVDLQPPTMNTGQSTLALGVDQAHNTEVGFLETPVQEVGFIGYTTDAVLWHGTADTLTDLGPSGYSFSEAIGAGSGYQVGYAAVSAGAQHAGVWSGTAASFVDLHPFLPPGYLSSKAVTVDKYGNIIGAAYTGASFTGSVTPVEWSLPGKTVVSASETPAPNGRGWNSSKVTLSLMSPYTSPGSTLQYKIGASASVTVSGGYAQVAISSDGSHVVQYSARDGASGQLTQVSQNTINIDTTTPKTTEAFGAGVVTLKAADDKGDLPTIYYSLDGGAPAVYSTPFAVSNVVHTLSYWSVDLAGNTEAAHTTTLGAYAPTLTALSPFRSFISTSDVTVDCIGGGFSSASVVQFNGAPLATTYVSPTSITAVIPAADLGTAASSQIEVVNSAPGVGATSSLPFVVAPYAQATGGFNADTLGTTTFDMTPITSFVGFTPSGASVHIVTDANTEFLNSYGVNIGNWIGGLDESGLTSVTVTGVYANGALTAWVAQE